MSKSISVIFHVIDENDHAPVFTQPIFYFYIRETAFIGEFVGLLEATDADVGDKIKYQIVNNEEFPFVLDTVSGILTLAKEIDFEKQAFYNFKVHVLDANFEDHAQVFVYIEDENDNPPRFIENGIIHVEIEENKPPGYVVHVFKFDDVDSGKF